MSHTLKWFSVQCLCALCERDEYLGKICYKIIIAPLAVGTKSVIDCTYDHPNIEFIAIENFNFLTVRNAVKATIKLPQITWKMYQAMRL
jgi:hypothetical protein